MKTIFFWSCLLVAFFEPCMSDVYMHFPPGSNNRLNGNRENVQNNKRLFDSQNNDKAGYNVGINSADRIGNQEEDQLPPEFYMSGCNAEAKSEVEIMWTNQHGTGPKTDHFVESQIILQYMCQGFPEEIYPNAKLDGGSEKFAYHTLRNGESTATTGFADRHPQEGYASKSRGLHESYYYYQTCYRRDRNRGLFIADQKLKKDTAIHTRQNPDGTRRGYECPEERDYYPYWAPTPWNIIATMVSDIKTLESMKKYFNGPEYGYKYLCMMPSKLAGNKDCPLIYRLNIPAFKCAAKDITSESCKVAGGTWTRFVTNYLEKSGGVLDDCGDHDSFKMVKGLPYEPHLVTHGTLEESQYIVVQPPPEVIYAPSTVVNHNGINMEGKFSSYKWKVPCFPTNTTQRCVLRIRYNITTDDAPREFTAKDNKKVNNNPKTKATDGTILQLALNTAQLSRTFQDRSHVIILKPRSFLPKEFQNSNIYYIGGMGKRGNIVQTYPAMEYRFHPERISVTTNDVICFVWSGSNTNPANNAGEGTQGTDRTNVCWVKEGCSSLKPKACSNLPLDVVNHVGMKFTANQLNSHLNKGCYTGSAKLQDQLNNAPASCNAPCFRINKPGVYCYMGTRNNNFSNRRHMGQITVTRAPK